jgi:hypothetical protein
VSDKKEKINLQIDGNKYIVDLERPMAEFIKSDLTRLGFELEGDNKIEILVKAYLQKVKERLEIETEVDGVLSTFQEE